MAKDGSKHGSGLTIGRRQVLSGLAAAGLAAPAGVGIGAGSARAQSTKTGVVRVWGEPGPYGNFGRSGYIICNPPKWNNDILNVSSSQSHKSYIIDAKEQGRNGLLSVFAPLRLRV